MARRRLHQAVGRGFPAGRQRRSRVAQSQSKWREAEDADEETLCGVLKVEDVPFPDDPFATFSGTLLLNAPTAATPGELVATVATIRNTTNPAAGITGGLLDREDIPFACAEFSLGGLPTVVAPGSLAVEIDAELHTDLPGGVLTAGNEELEITAVGTTFQVPAQPTSPPGEVAASWVSPGVTSAPQTISALASVAGQYNTGPGIIGLKMNIVLPEQESIFAPTSIEATVSTSTGVPSLGVRGFGLLVGAVLGFGALATWRGRRTPA